MHRSWAAQLRRGANQLPHGTPARTQPPAPIPWRKLPLGTAISWHQIEADPSLRELFLSRFDQLTPENEMKMERLQPRRGVFDFAVADQMVDMARSNGKRVRGHTLVWGSQNPGWIRTQEWTRDELLGVMEDHIKTVVRHFQGRVQEWDIVNEGVDFDGRYERNVWHEVIGPEYVEHAFRFARAADPHAKLYYNDNGIDELGHPHTKATLAMLRDLKRRGTPLDGVGIQSHHSNRWKPTEADLAETMRQLASLDLDVAITEMDVRIDTGGSLTEQLEAQARVYDTVARVCREQPRCKSFSTWGISDKYSWLGSSWMALPFDEGLRPKPAWAAIERWVRPAG